MQVERFLEDSASRWPDKAALVCGSRRLTYRELDEAANRFARVLVAAGLRRGDRVAIVLENSVEAVVAVFGALKAGAVFVILNPTIKADKLAFILADCGVVVLVSDRSRRSTWSAALDRLLRTSVIVLDETESDAAEAGGAVTALAPSTLFDRALDGSKPPNPSIDVDLAALIYTSGSTGTPKGVMLTHHNVVAAATSIAAYLAMTADDVVLDVLPLSFDYGLYQLFLAFQTGGTVVLEKSFAYPHVVLEKVVSERVTGLPIVPTLAAMLLRLDLGRYDLSALRFLTNTGAALPIGHVQELRARLPWVRIYSMYGLTECKRVSYLPPEQIDARPGSVGRAMPNVEVYVVDENGERLESGEGELVIRGSNVMRGYWQRPEETDLALRPGPLPGERVLYSGDLFRMDADGYLYFVGRKDDIIKTRGEKVSPREVENVLHQIPGVVEAAVVGIPDDVLGQAIKAFVTVQEGASVSSKDVLQHCASHLENFMVPKAIEFREALPKTDSGKIDKKPLIRAVAGAGAGARNDEVR